MYLHLTFTPLPPLQDGPPSRDNKSAIQFGKPTYGLWFSPNLRWVERLNRDKTWDLYGYTGQQQRFPYTLEIFQRILAGNTVRFGTSTPTAKPLTDFRTSQGNVPTQTYYAYKLPIEPSFETDITKPNPAKVLKLSTETIGSFEAAFHDYLRTILKDQRVILNKIKFYTDSLTTPVTSYMKPQLPMPRLIQAAFLTLVRQIGGNADKLYDRLIPEIIEGSVLDDYFESLPKRSPERAAFNKLFPKGMRMRTQSYEFNPERAPQEFIDTLRPPKDLDVPMEDTLDWILTREYGEFIDSVIVRKWGGVYYDESLFPETGSYFARVDAPRNFETLYRDYPILRRFPFLQWVEVSSGFILNPVQVLGTTELTPTFKVKLSDKDPTDEEKADTKLFIAGIDTSNQVFFYKSGTVGGGRSKTTRRRRQLKKTARKIR